MPSPCQRSSRPSRGSGSRHERTLRVLRGAQRRAVRAGRRGRRPETQRDPRVPLDRAHAQRRQPRHRRVRASVVRDGGRARARGAGSGVHRPGGRRGGGGSGSRHSGCDLQEPCDHGRRPTIRGEGVIETGLNSITVVALAPLVALVGAVVNGLIGRGIREPVTGIIASVATGAGFVLSLWAFFAYPADAEGYRYVFAEFLRAGTLSVDLGFAIDQLSLVMCMVITGVGFLIHVYSIGYMKGDSGHARYFAQLNLFVAAMLVLVLADSFPLMFVGWQGVGVCSFLLIGFWYQQRDNADAARKAFIVNRIGDVGFLLAMFLTFQVFGSLDINTVTQAAPGVAFGSAALVGIGLLFLLAAAGKSAQIPLQLWLPDAMAGPTPVSALIHAATMVTAGVYLIARTGPLFAQAPAAAATVAWIGVLTALIAAIAAFAQTDIKRILAYSTISQVGFMIAAVGAGAYWAGIFHVVTHAFFKALLFLGAGSVIHAMGGEQDVRR